VIQCQLRRAAKNPRRTSLGTTLWSLEEAILSADSAWVDDELSLRDRSLGGGAALITQGGAEQHLRAYTRWTIQHGCTRKQLEARATLLGVYAWLPTRLKRADGCARGTGQ
jgi:hypothetical protein